MMYQGIKTSWDLSDYYSGIDDKNFLDDISFFDASVKSKINKGMSYYTFHTYSDLVLFYKDFEEIISLYGKIGYFLHYKNTLDISDQKVLQKIREIDSISREFQKFVSRIYQDIHKNASQKFISSLKFEVATSSPYAFSVKKLLKNIDFYSAKDQKILNLVTKLQSNNQKIIHMQSENYTRFLQGLTSRNQFIEESMLCFYELIKNRCELANFSFHTSFFEYSLYDLDINPQVVMSILKSLESLNDFSVSSKKSNLGDISFGDAIDFLDGFFSQAFPEASEYFTFTLKNGDFDFFPHKNKISHSFTSGTYGKRPKICLNFLGKMTDIPTVVHEFGHAFQMWKSKNIAPLESIPSPFMSEFSAIFFERLLEDFCTRNSSYNDLGNYLQQSKRENIAFSYSMAMFEIDAYEAFVKGEFDTFLDFKDWISYKKNISGDFLFSVFSRMYLYQTPFYVISYIFGYIMSEIVFQKDNKLKIFNSIVSLGGSMMVDDMFQKNLKEDLFDIDLYERIALSIFHNDV